MDITEARAILDALSEPFPPHAIEQREGGRGKMLSYVATETVIRRLNAVVPTWDFRVTKTEWKDDLLIAWGELTIPGLGTRTGTGVQKIHPNGGEDLVKGAASDCLKKCATLFNVGIDLYGPDLEALDAQQAAQMARSATPARSTPQRPQNGPQGASGGGITDKQVYLARKLAKDLGIDRFEDYVVKQFGSPLEELSKGDGSSLIDRLTAKREAMVTT